MLANILIKITNGIIQAVGSVIGSMIDILPESPFIETITEIHNPISDYIEALNWIIPIDKIIIILTYWTMAISIYYFISIILRWVKVIE